MPPQLEPGTAWADVWARARSVAPEAFESDRTLNLMNGEWLARRAAW